MIDAIAYVRVSTDKQEYDLQLDAIRRACAADGNTLGRVYADSLSAWKPTERQGLTALLKDVAAGRHRGAVLYVFALSRVTRKGARDTFKTLDALAAGNVALRSTSESWIDTREQNPMKDLVIAVLATCANLESVAKSSRMKAWAQMKKSKGERIGRKPVVVPQDILRAIVERKLAIGAASRQLGIDRNTVKKSLRIYRRENPPSLAG